MGFRRTEVVHDFQLTDQELEIAQHLGNADLNKILRREGVGIGVHTNAYLKLAARVRAERILHQELLLLRAAKEQLASLAAAEDVIATVKKENRVLELEVKKLKSERVTENAAPAIIVHSDPRPRRPGHRRTGQRDTGGHDRPDRRAALRRCPPRRPR
jgi:hypothetical protein